VSRPQPRGRSRAEWVSLGISLLIVAVLVGILTVDQLRGPGREPRLTATVRREEVRQEGEAYYLPVEVTNGGDQAARDVRVRITLGPPAGGAGAGEAEVSELQLDFVPGGGRAGGAAVFRQDPRRAGGGGPAAVVTSYVDP
jgi:uncharacterized protein (TIGR02588 family)